MELISLNIWKYRIARHALFWLAWIFSFTFIKSFGASMDVYLAWFVYYIVTLPVFLVHTYFIVYYLGQKFTRGYRIIVFVILFLLSIYVFSVVELLICQWALATWFPAVFEKSESYLAPGNVFISGIGNLYIVLVFIAMRLIRKWYFSEEEKKNMNQLRLEDRVAEANARIQPSLLMYAFEKIEELAETGSENVSPAIAILSEILNGTMQTKGREVHRIDEELKLMRQLADLHALFNHHEPPKIHLNVSDMNNINVPALAFFTIMEIILRNMKELSKVSVDIRTDSESFSGSLNWETDEAPSACPSLIFISEQMDQFFPERFTLRQQFDGPRYMVSICE